MSDDPVKLARTMAMAMDKTFKDSNAANTWRAVANALEAAYAKIAELEKVLVGINVHRNALLRQADSLRSECDSWKSRAQQFQRERAELADKLNGTPCAEIRWQYECDSLRAKLERAKEALDNATSRARMNDSDGVQICVDNYHLKNGRRVLSELSADAPAQQTQRDVITQDKDIIFQALAEYDAWMLDDDYDATTALHIIMKRMRDRVLVAPAQQTRSAMMYEAMAAAEKALEPFAPINDLPYDDDRTCVIKFYEKNGEHIVPGFVWGDFRRTAAALAKLRGVMK